MKIPESFEFTKSFEKYSQFLNFVAYKYNLNYEKLTDDLQEFLKSERENLSKTTVVDDYKNFMDEHEEDLKTSLESKTVSRLPYVD